MAGHVPKYGAQNAESFTEVFALARPGAKAGASTQEDQPPARGGRGPPKEVASRRVTSASGAPEKQVPLPPLRGSSSGSGSGYGSSGGRSSQEGSNRPSARGGREAGQGGRKPRNINEEYAGASPLPKFGDWNNGDAADANYTVMFSNASKERRNGPTVDLGSKSAGRGSADMGRNSSSGPKKQSPSWWCFS